MIGNLGIETSSIFDKFLINSIGLKFDNKFFTLKLQNNIKSNNLLVNNIIGFIKKHKVKLSNKYSIIVNMGPGSYSSVRISLSVAKGIQIVHGSKLYGYKNSQLSELKLETIENLIKNKQLENKMVKWLFMSIAGVILIKILN